MQRSNGFQFQNVCGFTVKAGVSVCLVTDDFLSAKTGVGVHVQKIAPQLVRRGHPVVVITARQPGQPAQESWNGVSVYRFRGFSVAGFYQALPSK